MDFASPKDFKNYRKSFYEENVIFRIKFILFIIILIKKLRIKQMLLN